MKKFWLYLLYSFIIFSISYSEENLKNQTIKEQIKIEQLIEEIKELKEENKKIKEEIEKYKSEVDKKLEETKEITKDNLEFYDKSMASIKEQSDKVIAQSDRVIAQSDKFTNIVLELLGALGLASILFKAYDRKKLMKE